MPWAVHISEGVLAAPWVLGGFGVLLLLALLSTRRLSEEEIPQIALLTALFFVASSIHVPAGPVRVHLLLNGLIGLLAPWRAALIVPIGLFLQAALLGHGSFSTLGVSSCVLVFPAYLAGVLFHAARHVAWSAHPRGRMLLVGISVLVWLVSLVLSISLLLHSGLGDEDGSGTWQVLLHPGVIAGLLAATACVVWAEHRMGHPPEFALGLLLGSVTVQLTLVLDCVVLVYGGQENWQTLAYVIFLAHLPIAAVEGVVLGFLVSFLRKVTPGFTL